MEEEMSCGPQRRLLILKSTVAILVETIEQNSIAFFVGPQDGNAMSLSR